MGGFGGGRRFEGIGKLDALNRIHPSKPYQTVEREGLCESVRVSPCAVLDTLWGRGGKGTYENLLELVVHGQDTGTGDTTEDVCASTLEERGDTLLGNDLSSTVEHARVVGSLAGRHHHSSSDGVERVRGNAGTSGDTPAEEEGGEERALERAGEDDGLEGVVHAEVETSVDNDTDDGRDESSVDWAWMPE